MTEDTSRYNYMKESLQVDPESEESYPDPLTFKYKDYKEDSKQGVSRTMHRSDIIMLNKCLASNYGRVEYDDIIVELNGYSHKNFIKEGDVMYFPPLDDLKKRFE